MKWIILAGGLGTRLYPVTLTTSKQLLPVYDKPMIYYPLSVLMLAGIRDILLISTSYDQMSFQKLLWDGSEWWVNISYAIQPAPNGLAEAFVIGQEFIDQDDVCLVLGDNIFYGQGLSWILKTNIQRVRNEKKSVIFVHEVSHPERYGVLAFEGENIIRIEEKPAVPQSSFAVTGLYIYTNDVIEVAHKVQPSIRWQKEITDVNMYYLGQEKLHVEVLNRGFAWFDAGTYESMLETGNFIHIIEKQQGLKIGCIEEIAYLNGWISAENISRIAQKFYNSGYGKYLLKILR